jgi:uncharacterized protein (TIGR02246 family)
MTPMNTQTTQHHGASSADETAVRACYHSLLSAWNRRDAAGYAALFAEDGNAIGFDGSQHDGREMIATEIGGIFATHQTGTYIGKVKDVQFVTADVAILRAISAVVPAGQADLNPATNALQTLVAAQRDGDWRIVLFQNTPAQFHGRPELAEQLTEELRQLLA